MNFFKKKIYIKKSRGFTMLEILIYMVFLFSIVGIITALITQIIKVNHIVEVTDDVIGSARGTVEVVAQEIRHASSIYSPTSNFGTNFGQLSLETTRDVPTGETSTFVDIYVDNGRLYLKREENNPVLLTADNVIVDNLIFTYLNQSAVIPAVRMQITLSNNTSSVAPFARRSITLTNTVSLRSYE